MPLLPGADSLDGHQHPPPPAGAGVSAGACALRVKNGTGGGKVAQKIPAAGIVSGSTLDVSAMVSGKNVPAGAVIKIKLVTVSGKNIYNLPLPSNTFSIQPVSHPTIAVDAQATKLKVMIVYPTGDGKLWADEVSIIAGAP